MCIRDSPRRTPTEFHSCQILFPQKRLSILDEVTWNRSTRDRSIPRSLQRWVSTKSSQLTYFQFFLMYIMRQNKVNQMFQMFLDGTYVLLWWMNVLEQLYARFVAFCCMQLLGCDVFYAWSTLDPIRMLYIVPLSHQIAGDTKLRTACVIEKLGTYWLLHSSSHERTRVTFILRIYSLYNKYFLTVCRILAGFPFIIFFLRGQGTPEVTLDFRDANIPSFSDR